MNAFYKLWDSRGRPYPIPIELLFAEIIRSTYVQPYAPFGSVPPMRSREAHSK